MRVPRRVTIETIYGCNASCTMCPIDLPAPRKKGLMPLATSTKVLDELADHTAHIDKLDFFGLGEPLLDPHLFARIAHAKSRGYRNIAISSNCQLLDARRQAALLESGLDTLICSIDGATAATHEAIRRRTRFADVVRNCEQAIARRDRGGYGTRFVVRFVRQDSNRHEWPTFRRFWNERLSPQRKDLLIVHDVHDWTGSMGAAPAAAAGPMPRPAPPCTKPFDSLVVLANGVVPLCTEDWHRASHCFGNVNDTHALEIFNAPAFERIRAAHAAGERERVALCRQCTVHLAARGRTVVTPEGRSPAYADSASAASASAAASNTSG